MEILEGDDLRGSLSTKSDDEAIDRGFFYFYLISSKSTYNFNSKTPEELIIKLFHGDWGSIKLSPHSEYAFTVSQKLSLYSSSSFHLISLDDSLLIFRNLCKLKGFR